jgi:hypothetical protein
LRTFHEGAVSILPRLCPFAVALPVGATDP